MRGIDFFQDGEGDFFTLLRTMVAGRLIDGLLGNLHGGPRRLCLDAGHFNERGRSWKVGHPAEAQRRLLKPVQPAFWQEPECDNSCTLAKLRARTQDLLLESKCTTI